MTFEPGHAVFKQTGNQGNVIGTRDLQPVNHDGGRMRKTPFSVTGEPTPPAITDLHFCNPLQPFLHHSVHFVGVKDRVAVVAFPLLRTFRINPDFLSVQVAEMRFH